MEFFKTFIGSVFFTIAVLSFINFAGDVLVGPTTHIKNDGHEVTAAKTEAAPETPKPVVGKSTLKPLTPELVAPPPVAVAPVSPAPEPAATAPVAPAPVVVASAGNVKTGFKTFRKKCLSCHPVSSDGVNRTGPNLWGVIGRTKAVVDGYRYSSGLKKLGGVWSEKDINTFIAGPRVMVPKTKMTFSGVKKENQRNDIIAYLKTLSN